MSTPAKTQKKTPVHVAKQNTGAGCNAQEQDHIMTDNSTVQMTELQDLIENLVTAVVEQGTSGRFTITQLCKIAEALGVTPASLMAPGNLSKAQAI